MTTLTASWTAKEIELLEALTLKVLVLTEEQLERGWPDVDVAPLVEVGLVERRELFAHPILDVATPALHWGPGDPVPTAEQFAALAAHFKSRWATEPEQQFSVYVPTRRAANLMGSHVISPPKDVQWTHDIHVSEIYLMLREANPPEVFRRLVGEGSLPKLGHEIWKMKDPDLFLCDSHRQAEIVFEFAGAYEEKHLRDLHAHCSGAAHWKMKKRYPKRKYLLYPNPKGTEYFLF